MSTDKPTPLEIAQRIADGESLDSQALNAQDPELARRLQKLESLAKAMHGGASGQTWGYLQRLELAGQGGFGEVYRAYDPTLDRTVALKLKRNDSDSILASGRDFVAEARRLARVRHPHVLAVHGASFHDGRVGLWADWIEGETLSERLRSNQEFSSAELLRVLHELSGAITAVHAAGLVHGDIKASNVMLDKNGRVVLMDFGAGFESSEDGTPMTAGTPSYLAPEIKQGNPATLAVDLYAFGVLAHLLSASKFPQQEKVDARVKSLGLRKLITQLLDSNPNHRPRAAQIQTDIQAIIDAPLKRLKRLALSAVFIGLIGIVGATGVGMYREYTQRVLAEKALAETAATSEFLAQILSAPAPQMQGRDVKVIELLQTASLRAENAQALSPSIRAGLLLTIGRSQLALNKFRVADETLSKALVLDTAQNNLDAESVLQIGLAAIEARTRRKLFEDADALLKTYQQDLRWKSNPSAQLQLQIRHAHWLELQSKDVEAEKVLRHVLSEQDRLPFAQQIIAMTTLSKSLFGQRKMAESEAIVQEALSLIEAQQVRDGTFEFELRTLLANTLNEQGRFDDAEKNHIALGAWAIKEFGADTSTHLMTLGNLGVVKINQGKFAEAVTLFQSLIPKAEAIDSKQSALVLMLRSNLASALYQDGQLDSALTEYDTLIELDKSHFGPQHPQTLIDRFNQVEAINTTGRHALALERALQLHKDMTAVVGPDHPFTLETEDAIGYAYSALGDGKKAEAMHRRTIAKKTEIIGAENPYTLISREYLARALIAQKRNAEARAELTQLLADRQKHLGLQHPKTKTTAKLLMSIAK